MTNPYETPTIVHEPKRATSPLLRWAAGGLCIVFSIMSLIYALLIASVILWARTAGNVFSGSGIVLVFVCLVALFGIGLAVSGYGILCSRADLSRRGALLVGAAIASYVVLAIALP